MVDKLLVRADLRLSLARVLILKNAVGVLGIYFVLALIMLVPQECLPDGFWPT